MATSEVPLDWNTHYESTDADGDDTDAILAEMEAEISNPDPNSAAYQQQIQDLQNQTSQPARNAIVTSRVTYYTVLKTDSDTLQFTTEHAKSLVHFRHADFARCATMDDHLERIAQRYGTGEAGGEDLAFARVDVTNAPFVVEKLGVRVLPCVIGFVGGVVKGRVVGFEGICWDGREGSERVTRALEGRLVEWGLVKERKRGDDDDDDDEDDQSEEDDGGRKGKIGQQRRGIKGSNRRVKDEDDDEWD